MARTINEIEKQILEAKENTPDLNGLTSTSKNAVWRNFIYIISVAIWTLEKIFNQHKQEVDQTLLSLKTHRAFWYRQKAKDFQFGFKLLEDSDLFDNQGYLPDEIAESKIIKYAAVVESETESRLIVKIATEQDDVLTPINNEQLESFKVYFNEIKDAGVPITVINYLPDILYLKIRIFRDPLVLSENGVSILTGKKPVEQAIKQYMKELPFNGELVLQELANKLENTQGVKIVQIDTAMSKWVDSNTNGYGDYTVIDVKKLPVSGYFQVENFDTISYVV